MTPPLRPQPDDEVARARAALDEIRRARAALTEIRSGGQVAPPQVAPTAADTASAKGLTGLSGGAQRFTPEQAGSLRRQWEPTGDIALTAVDQGLLGLPKHIAGAINAGATALGYPLMPGGYEGPVNEVRQRENALSPEVREQAATTGMLASAPLLPFGGAKAGAGPLRQILRSGWQGGTLVGTQEAANAPEGQRVPAFAWGFGKGALFGAGLTGAAELGVRAAGMGTGLAADRVLAQTAEADRRTLPEVLAPRAGETATTTGQERLGRTGNTLALKITGQGGAPADRLVQGAESTIGAHEARVNEITQRQDAVVADIRAQRQADIQAVATRASDELAGLKESASEQRLGLKQRGQAVIRTARDVAKAAAQRVLAGAPQRVARLIEDVAGQPVGDAALMAKQHVREGQALSKPFYLAAEQSPVRLPLGPAVGKRTGMTASELLLSEPVQAAHAAASKVEGWRNKDLIDIYGEGTAPPNPLGIEQAQSEALGPQAARGPRVIKEAPDANTLNFIKKGLDLIVEGGPEAAMAAGETGIPRELAAKSYPRRVVGDIKRDLMDMATGGENPVMPELAQALKVYRGHLEHADAIEEAAGWLKRGVTDKQITARLADLTAASGAEVATSARLAALDGLRNQLLNRTGGGALRPLTPALEAKLRVLLPDAAAYQSFMRGLEYETARGAEVARLAPDAALQAKQGVERQLASQRTDVQGQARTIQRGARRQAAAITQRGQQSIATRQALAQVEKDALPQEPVTVARSIIGAARTTRGPGTDLIAQGAAEKAAGLGFRGRWDMAHGAVRNLTHAGRYSEPVANTLVDFLQASGPGLAQQEAEIAARQHFMNAALRGALLGARMTGTKAHP